jgi:hypothetical protein
MMHDQTEANYAGPQTFILFSHFSTPIFLSPPPFLFCQIKKFKQKTHLIIFIYIQSMGSHSSSAAVDKTMGPKHRGEGETDRGGEDEANQSTFFIRAMAWLSNFSRATYWSKLKLVFRFA